ncbi:hypothetical protein BEN78_14830 [Xanthomonas citri pv. mangiferaeindicae]|nr:hypothetical protein BEN78_14830 [Xanthomonas citri pv. mangiferaeindicae]
MAASGSLSGSGVAGGGIDRAADAVLARGAVESIPCGFDLRNTQNSRMASVQKALKEIPIRSACVCASSSRSMGNLRLNFFTSGLDVFMAPLWPHFGATCNGH